MSIAPVELDRVPADRDDREGMDAGVRGWSGLQTDSARAALSEIRRWVDGIVPVAPSDANVPFVGTRDRKSTRLNSSHGYISYAVFCLKKKTDSSTPMHSCMP